MIVRPSISTWCLAWCAVVLGGVAVGVTRMPASVEPLAGEQEITFGSPPLRLTGTLIRPHARGNVPGIVLLHGSGPGPRSALRPMAERFVADGFAALVFDKRGSGGSAGSWTDASLDDLADDALVAVAFLKSQPGIDAHHVGMWGISQVGWVIPHVLSRQADTAAFAIVITGGAVRPIDVER